MASNMGVAWLFACQFSRNNGGVFLHINRAWIRCAARI
jgi:hypothetical protein